MLNDFFECRIAHAEDGKLSGRIQFNPGHPIFKGHFPGQPVVPGVCTMAVAKMVMEQQLEKKLRLVSAGNVKFLRLLMPQDEPEFILNYEQKETGLHTQVSILLDGQAVFKMNGFYLVK